ncbi:MAG TPA: MotA/TolQ/ExbB proton channel family protein [candidate division WOR-3 bacterium]|uniref:MotA/TolQ/ExbB proton channel family protein n=1 Tax=candidate division WOR-3 bacterium TaxID=2052148 RepID=A0A9C9ELE3_UNCW3|nr:MotA/TolQ/ExbB proton channel family protein [candidate division WOR-3 bacterium]
MILGQPIIEIFKNSLVMDILLFCSIVALALIIERFIYFRKNGFNTRKGFLQFSSILRSQGPNAALNYVNQRKNTLNALFAIALENRHLESDHLFEVLTSFIIEEKVKFDRYLGGMGTLANAATLLGLLGTVMGLIKSFHNIAITGSGGPAVISAGIAEALLTTAFGLFIGIPTLFFYNYFTKKSNEMAMELDGVSDRITVLFSNLKKKAASQGPATASQPAVNPTPAPQAPAPPPTNAGWKF